MPGCTHAKLAPQPPLSLALVVDAVWMVTIPPSALVPPQLMSTSSHIFSPLFSTTISLTLDKVKERIEGMDPEELSAGQIPAALRTLIELELKVLGYEDRVAVTGKDGGPVKVEAKTQIQHVFQPSQEVWDDVLRERAKYERLRDGDSDEETASDSL